jgi:hypothetical protein
VPKKGDVETEMVESRGLKKKWDKVHREQVRQELKVKNNKH